MYNQIFVTNVLRLLKQQDITKVDLAAMAGVSVSFLSDLTNSKANPSLRIMEAIAGALAVPLPMLLRDPQVALNDKTKAVEGTYILTEFQAYTAAKWDAQNRQKASRYHVQ